MPLPDFYSAEIKDETIQTAFQTLYAQLRAFLNVSHNDDGTLIPAAPNVGICPIGFIGEYGGLTDPSNWLICDGRQVSRVTYASLFAVIGTQFGVGDGSTTFNIPDMRGRFPLGKAAAGTGSTMGATGGAIDHTHAGGAITGSTATGSTGTGTTGTGTTGTGTTGTGTATISGSTASATDTFTTSTPDSLSVVSAGATDNRPQAGHKHTGTTDGHSHGAGTLSAAVPGLSIPGLSIPGLSVPSLSIPALGAGTLTMAATGSANPPYQVVNYIILAGV